MSNQNIGLKTNRSLRTQRLGTVYRTVISSSVLIDENNDIVPNEEATIILRSYCAQKVDIPDIEGRLKERALQMAQEIAENDLQLIITSENSEEQYARINLMLTRKALSLLPIVPDSFRFAGKEYRYKVTQDSVMGDSLYVPDGATTTNEISDNTTNKPYSYYNNEITNMAARIFATVLQPEIKLDSESNCYTLYIGGVPKVQYKTARIVSSPETGEVCFDFFGDVKK